MTYLFLIAALMLTLTASALSVRAGQLRVTGWRSDIGLMVGAAGVVLAFWAGRWW